MELISPSSFSTGLLIWQLAMLVYLGFWVYALLEVLRNEFRGAHERLMWILIILFAPIIGTFLYLSMGRRARKRRKFNPDFNSKHT
ncbi:PLDc N-terminal domain-containing protein [Algoriphagus sp.]|uniref:PLDc N-terminal domain-containing protein n=1 Tax=Algoriphagus sp. TaxID=1872435 RepID=UPI00261091D2|nr:PLDc N-terminal domain-containing protein [Algoriphagus sp.]